MIIETAVCPGCNTLQVQSLTPSIPAGVFPYHLVLSALTEGDFLFPPSAGEPETIASVVLNAQIPVTVFQLGFSTVLVLSPSVPSPVASL